METNDLAAKNFETYPDVAADIINVLIYEGQQRIDKDSLLASPTETVYQGRENLRNQLEDVARYEMCDGRVIMQYLFANQTRLDPKMIFRKAGYIGGAYREQYDGKIKDFYPVIEIILYWGEGSWKQNRSIYEMFQDRDYPEKVLNYIDDLKLHVFEMRKLSKEIRNLFQSDMRIVVDYLAEGNGYRSDQKVVHKEALIKFLRTLSGEENVEDTLECLQKMGVKEEDEITVCELFDQYTRQGRQEGIKEGIKEGKKEGIKEGIREGLREGLKEGIQALIVTCKELGADFDRTEDKVKQRFHLSDADAAENMRLYW